MSFERLWQGTGALSAEELEQLTKMALEQPSILEAGHRVALDERQYQENFRKLDPALDLQLDEQIKRFALQTMPRSVWQDWNEIRAQINHYIDQHWLSDLLAVRKGRWTIKTDRRYLDLGHPMGGDHIGFWVFDKYALKDDGTKIALKFGGRAQDYAYRYNYQSSGFSLEIPASRAGPNGGISDTFIVLAVLPPSLTRTQALSIARDLREALLPLPPDPAAHEGRPATGVEFDWSVWNSRHPEFPIEQECP